ncbi:MAG: hypothetical protein HY964_00675 [Ignavibacteriales bacterium]|nr:hypothetical protein [Ignavibacteriales bacterium]
MMNRLPTVLYIALVFFTRSVSYTQAITADIAATNYDTLKIVSYNLLNYPNDNTTRDPFMRRVIHSVKPDILVVQEMTSSSGVTAFLNNVLNYYQAGLYTTIAFHDGPDTDNHIFLKTGKASVVSAGYITTALRDIAEYVVRLTSSNDTVRLYSLHLKASTGFETDRLAEATILRNHLNSLPAGTKFMVMGDYNIYTSTEPAFQKLISSETDNDGRCKDPINAVGDWNNNATFKLIHTQSPRVRAFGGGSTGGMDDRFDIILTSYSSLDNNTIVSSYKAYGNDGNHFNDSINRLPNSAVPDSVANGLHYGSDHLPVTCNFKFEKSVGSFILISPSNGATNQTISGILKWQSSINAAGYDLYFDQNNPPTTIVSTNQTDTTYSYTNLVQGKQYYWKVIAKNGSKTVSSSLWNFTTLSLNPPSEFNLISPANGSTNQNLNGSLSWQSALDAEGYDIYLDTINPPVIKVDSNISNTTYSYTNLHGGKTYYWKVVAKNSAGATTATNTPWSFITAFPPAQPTSLTPVTITPNAISLAWVDNATDEEGYRVYRSVGETGPFSNVSGNLGINSSAYTDTGLEVNHRYYYRVVAFNIVGESDYSSIQKATLALTPGSPSIKEVTPHSFRIIINPDSNNSVTEYSVRVIKSVDTFYVRNDGLLSSTKIWNTFQMFGGTTGIVVNNLDSATAYTLDVVARNIDNIETDYSSQVTQFLPSYLFNGTVDAGWNLISLPVSVTDAAKQTLFPSSISNAYMYNGSYVLADILSQGTGYWIKFGSSVTVEIAGNPVNSDTIDLVDGWNLVGSITQPMLVSSLFTIPTGVTLSPFFQYQGSYNLSTTLEPLKAYWVKTSIACQLVLNPGMINLKSNIDFQDEKIPNNQNVLSFSDKAGNRQVLYIVSDLENRRSSYALPPLPPGDGFDVRFKSNSNLEYLSDDKSLTEFPISIQASAYPVMLSWNLTDKNHAFSIINGSKEDNLSVAGETNITNSSSIIISVKSLKDVQQPQQFKLNHNYPNPFNPETFISYELPERSSVRLAIFNNLGEEVAVLDEGLKESGNYRFRWEPESAGGVYYYRLLATSVIDNSKSYQLVRRMVFLK